MSADEKIRQEAWIREKTLNDYYSDVCNDREEGIEKGKMNILETMKRLGYSQEDIVDTPHD